MGVRLTFIGISGDSIVLSVISGAFTQAVVIPQCNVHPDRGEGIAGHGRWECPPRPIIDTDIRNMRRAEFPQSMSA